MMGNTVQKGLWLDPRAKLFLIMGFSLLSASEFLQTEKWRCAKQ